MNRKWLFQSDHTFVRAENDFSAHNGHQDRNIADLVWIDGQNILIKHHEVGQFAGFNGAFDILMMILLGAVYDVLPDGWNPVMRAKYFA